jgi:hypothetical protein
VLKAIDLKVMLISNANCQLVVFQLIISLIVNVIYRLYVPFPSLSLPLSFSLSHSPLSAYPSPFVSLSLLLTPFPSVSTSLPLISLPGNQFFKKKDYSTALVQYMDSLKVLPYDSKTLLNIAQVGSDEGGEAGDRWKQGRQGETCMESLDIV